MLKKILNTCCLLAIIAGCDQGGKIVYQLSYDIPASKVSLHRIGANKLTPLGEFESLGDNRFQMPINSLEAGMYKIMVRGDFKTKSLNFLSEGDLSSLHIIESSDSLFAYGSKETERLFKILNHTKGCDKRNVAIQRKMMQYRHDPDSSRYFADQASSLQSACIRDLVSYVREDVESLASLYAVDFLDPYENLTLIDSIFCATKEKYGEIYLHNEIVSRLPSDRGELSCSTN